MDWTKILRTTLLAGLFAAFLFSSPGSAASQRWTTLSSLADVRKMMIIHDSVYCATSGGLLVIGDFNNPGAVYTNTSGLGTVDITDIMVDATGQVWLTGNGRLIKFGSNQDPYLILDNNNAFVRLLCVVDDGDYLWIGTESGLILFSKTQFGGEIQDSYTRFGDLNAAPDVQGILLDGDSIWIATSAGLAVTDRSNRLAMKSPSAWTSFSRNSYPELGTSNFKRVVKFEASFFVATDNGVFRLDRSSTDTSFTSIPFGAGWNITDLQIQNDSLFVYFPNGMAVDKDSGFAYLPLPGLTSKPQTGINTGTARWVGINGGGIYRNSTGSFEQYTHTGLPSNDVTGVAVDKSGNVTALLRTAGVAQLIDSVWVQRPIQVGNHTIGLITDSNNYAWAGTFGNGLWRITPDTTKRFDNTNSTLRGNSDPNGSGYVVVNGIATDGNLLFVGCYRALNNYPIAFCDYDKIDLPGAWDSLGLTDGITSTSVSCLDYQNGNLVMGTLSTGLYWFYFGADPHDKSTDSCRYKNKDNSFLRSDVVNVVKFAPNGTLWVGTNFGLSQYDAGIDQFVNVNLPSGIGPEITDIDFDPQGNLWASAHNGLARFDALSGTFEILNSLNSGLVADDIRAITLDKRTGNLWIATSSGISLLGSEIANPTQNVDSILAFPNPFVIRSATDRLRFTFIRPGTVQIFSVAGELIDELPVGSSWDGRNQKGRAVSSGVYLFVVTDQDGHKARGKFLLVNQQ